MNMKQIFGVVAFVVGATLLGFAYHFSNAPLDQLSNTLTGRYTDQTMWYVILGLMAVFGGGGMIMVGRRAS